MRVSLKWISKYIDVKEFFADPQRLADILTASGLEVEAVVDQAALFANVVTGQILEKQKHPNADLLSHCYVDVGIDKRWIVCGAKNHKQGDKVVVALPGAVLPGNFEIKVSKIRGSESHGMLCSLKELGLSEEGEGIVILPPETPVGVPFATSQGLDDVLFDVKITPNRADCLSHLGLAREISALTGKSYEMPIKPFVETRESSRAIVKLRVEDHERCPRFTGRVIRNVKVGPSPAWLKQALESVGQRSINNVVDITNFVMLEIGQPMHAYDLTQLAGREIVVRSAQKGEKFTTLDNKNITLEGGELLICDAQKPVGLAGIKGGLNSGVTENTKDVFLESAYFVPWTVRRSSRLHGIDTDSSYRFSRGVDPEAVLLALNRASQLFVELAGGEACGEIWDIYPKPVAKLRIDFDLDFISARLGVVLTMHDARKALERVGCQVNNTGNKFFVIPPAYRLDLKIQEDLGEEILRIRGYQQIPETFPSGQVEPKAHDPVYSQARRLAGFLRETGINESVNFGFIASEFEKRFFGSNRGDEQEMGFSFKLQPIHLLNPLNQDLDVMRTSLLGWLARGAAYNIRHGGKSGALFEIGSVFSEEKAQFQDEERPFWEGQRVAAILWGDEPGKGELPYVENAFAFFRLKGALESMVENLGLRNFKLEPLKNVPEIFHPGQAARVVAEGKSLGVIGTLHPEKAEMLEMRGQVAIFELDFAKLMQGQPRATRTQSIPRFPAVERDVALVVPEAVSSMAVQQELTKAAGKILVSCSLFDFYQGEKVGKGKHSLAYRLIYQDPSKTLSDEEVNALHQKAVDAVCKMLGLSIR